ncbi:hypothetical protein ATK30_4984 [Amycolatopsis echigonensis]|uniref:DNA-binding MarR family transcriptional regulator n=1 Tax=Amycolatopsis echigonensis TaxID=2576905 RepID=A0A2N3WJS8_9PSEU|nr:hypothetical protein [Amycolatopsis niigatensis]PKV94112.1 hypothetical protein ATK30_4984 [Amycolatopsis niigatensis]
MTTFNARTVVIAAAALTARRDTILGQAGLGFVESLVLRAVAAGSATPDEVAAAVVTPNVIDEAQVSAALESLTAAGLIDGAISATTKGEALNARINAANARSSALLLDGIDERDLAVVTRVLDLITERSATPLAL